MAAASSRLRMLLATSVFICCLILLLMHLLKTSALEGLGLGRQPCIASRNAWHACSITDAVALSCTACAELHR